MSNAVDDSAYDPSSQVADLDVLHDFLQDNGSSEADESYNYKRASADNLFERLNTVALSAKSEISYYESTQDSRSPDVVTAVDPTTDDHMAAVEDSTDLVATTLTDPAVETNTDVLVFDPPSPTDHNVASPSIAIEEETASEIDAWRHVAENTEDDLTDPLDGFAESLAELPVEPSIDSISVDKATADVNSTADISLMPSEESYLPPPAPSVAPRPFVQGSMTAEDEEDDSDSDEDVNSHEDAHILPPPLHLETVDDEDQLEVDSTVAEEIQRVANVVKDQSQQQSVKENVLLDVLNEVPSVSTVSLEEGDVTVSFDEERPVSQPTVLEEEAHPESSVKTFGIGYHNMRKSHQKQSNEYALPSGTDAFHELEHELTLTTDLSLQGNTDDIEEEFMISSVVEQESSMERVQALLDKQKDMLVSRAAEEAILLEEMRLATEAERVQISTEEQQENVPKPIENENALTLTELHTIYKKGFGDQEVLMLEEVIESKSSLEMGKTSGISPPLTVMGQILSKKSIVGQAITEAEEGEEEQEEEDNRPPSSAGLYGDAPTSSRNKEEDEEVENEWNEVLLSRTDSANGSAFVNAPHTTDSRPIAIAKVPSPAVSPSPTIRYEKALEYFMSSDELLEDAIDRIVVEDFPAPSMLPCFACLSPRPRLTFPQAIEQRERLFCIAATPLHPRNVVHIQLLQTIYRTLMQTQRDVPLMGAHWEEIGFQGSDPATDLRGCGVLSLLQMVYLVDHHRAFALRFHDASQHKVSHFPMACALINITLHCLMALRSGALYPECNKQSSVFDGFNTLFIALTTELLRQVEASSDAFPLIMKKVLDHGRVHPNKFIRQVQASPLNKSQTVNASSSRQAEARKSTRTSVGGKKTSMSNIEFTEIGLQSNSEGIVDHRVQ